MDRKLIAFFVIPFALFSCSPAREEAESVLLVTSERVAAADSVFYPLANVQNCYILGDTLLVARHLSDAGTRAFSVYDIRTRELVRSLDYGADDAAVLSVALTVSPEGVLIHDFVKERMALLSPEAVGRPGPVEFRPTNISSQQSVAVSGGRIMYLNPASFEGEAERLLLSDEQYQGPPEKRRGYDNFDVVMGYILPARDGSRTYFVSRNTGEIELYDAEQKLLKQVRDAEFEQMKARLASLEAEKNQAEMLSTASDILKDAGINVSSKLVAHLIAETADETKANVDEFVKLYNDAVNKGVKAAMKAAGSSPKRKGGSSASDEWTKEKIYEVKDPIKRQQLIKEHWELFKN